MKRLKYTLVNVFKISNIGTIVFFCLNFFFLLATFGSMGSEGITGCISFIGIYIVSLLFSFSSIGQAMLCMINGARKMVRLDMREKTLPIVEEVFTAAKRKTPELPDRINVRIMYDSNPNAFAIGTNTICLTEGMLELPENLMAGVIAHEMGHLALQHTVIQILIGGGNIIMSLIMISLEILRLICTACTVGGATSKKDDGSWVAAILAGISAAIIFMWTKLCMLILNGSSRANEYAADAYAYEIGYGEDLAEALDRLTMGIPQSTFLKTLSESHPEPGERIGRLQSMGVSYSRY